MKNLVIDFIKENKGVILKRALIVGGLAALALVIKANIKTDKEETIEVSETSDEEKSEV